MDRFLKAMRHCLFFILLSIACYKSQAQNLVPNPSFEEYNVCGQVNVDCKTVSSTHDTPCISSCCAGALPQNTFEVNSATKNWSGVNLFIPPHYLNACIIKTGFFPNNDKSFYKPRTGNAHIMINSFGYWSSDTTDYRQYAQVRFTEPLKVGCRYEVACYALLTPNYNQYLNAGKQDSQTSADGLGIFLSIDSIYMNDESQKFEAFTSIVPQIENPAGHLLTDSVNYQKVSGIFQAKGGEQWLIIGNFKDNAHTQIGANKDTSSSLYSIDDVSVQLWRPNLISMTDTTICKDSSFVLTLPEGLSNYLWSTGDTTKQIRVKHAGTYTVQASNGCEILQDQFTLHTRARYTQPFTIGKDTFFCKVPPAFPLTAPSGFNKYLWSNKSTLSHTTINAAGRYKVTASYECGTLSDSILITEFKKSDTLLIPTIDTTICSNQSLDLQVYKKNNYLNFKWSNNSTLNHLVINQPGTYKLKVTTSQGCEVVDSIKITMIYPPLIHHFPDTVACQSTSLTLELHPSDTENLQWYDGKTSPVHDFNSSGVYWVRMSNSCYISVDTFAINFLDCSLNIPNLITNNNDGMNDYFFIQTKIDRPLNISIFNAWGDQVFKAEDYKSQWGGSDVKDGIYFYQISDPLLNRNYKGWIQVLR